jgi:hypothetical protein
MGKQCPGNCFISFLWFANVFLPFAVLHQTKNCSFSQWVYPPAIRPYQEYTNYLDDVVIYNLKWELLEALASPHPSSSAGDDRFANV